MPMSNKRIFRFKVTRTSYWDGSPCPEAKSVAVRKMWDYRTFPSLEAWKAQFPRDFNSTEDRTILKRMDVQGKNVGCGMLVRWKDARTIHYVEFASLKEVLAFIKKHGGRVVLSHYEREYEDAPKIDGHLEIYDDYRE